MSRTRKKKLDEKIIWLFEHFSDPTTRIQRHFGWRFHRGTNGFRPVLRYLDSFCFVVLSQIWIHRNRRRTRNGSIIWSDLFFLCSFFCFQSKRASTGSTGSALGFCNPLLHQRTTTFRVVTEMSSSSSSSSSSLPQNKSDSSRDFPSPSQWKRSYKIENIKKSSRKWKEIIRR